MKQWMMSAMLAVAAMAPTAAAVTVDQKEVAIFPACVLLTEAEIAEVWGGPPLAAYAPAGADANSSYCTIYSGPKGERLTLDVHVGYWTEQTGVERLKWVMSLPGAMNNSKEVEGLGELAHEPKDMSGKYEYAVTFARGRHMVTLTVTTAHYNTLEPLPSLSRDQVLKAAFFMAAKDLETVAPYPFNGAAAE